MANEHTIRNARVEGTTMHLIVDGIPHAFDLPRRSRRLAGATPGQLANFRIAASGYGIHWPDVDEDLTIDGLIRGVTVTA
jgi:hypothetical protein